MRYLFLILLLTLTTSAYSANMERRQTPSIVDGNLVILHEVLLEDLDTGKMVVVDRHVEETGMTKADYVSKLESDITTIDADALAKKSVLQDLVTELKK